MAGEEVGVTAQPDSGGKAAGEEREARGVRGQVSGPSGGSGAESEDRGSREPPASRAGGGGRGEIGSRRKSWVIGGQASRGGGRDLITTIITIICLTLNSQR